MDSNNPEPGITVADLRTHTIAGVVQGLIEHMILEGELEPGQRLNETALAARLAVSRGSVREACRSLVELGLLRLVPNRGIFVRRFTKQDLAEVFDLRAGLVALSALLLMPLLRTDLLAALDCMMNDMEEAAQLGDFARYETLNLEFHDFMVRTTGNTRLIRFYRRLAKEFHMLRVHGLVDGASLLQSNKEHREIVSALKARDASRSYQASFRHVGQGKLRMLSALDKLPPKALDQDSE